MKVHINSKEKNFPENTTIMDYLKQNDFHIAGVCKMKELDPYGSCRLCLIDINNRLLPACATYPKENDIINTNTSKVIDSRRIALELMISDHYGDCIGPCNNGCPTKSQVQNYLALIAMGKYHEAVALMKKDYILPAALGRVCPAFCEKDCRRNLVDEPVAIRLAKRFVADYDLEHGPWMPEIPPETGKSIAVIGGGPAGLSAAFYLRIKGHNVTIYEAMPKLGGMLRYGIPEYRLPKAILDKDIDTVIKTGIKVITNTKIGKDITIEELRTKHDAVFIGIGAWKSFQPRITNCEISGVMDAIDFLNRFSKGEEIELGHNVMVVGGGNSAMDVARTAIRLGSNVYVSYRRSKNEMPASAIEIEEAEEEGVNFLELTNPVNILGVDKVKEIEMVKMELGEPDESGRCRPIVCEGSNYCVEMDTIIFAIGQRPDSSLFENMGIECHMWGGIKSDDITYETNLDGVFVAGDAALGATTVIEAIATAKNAAFMIDWFLQGELPKIRNVLKEPWNHLDDIYSNEKIKQFILSYSPYNHWKKVTSEDYKDKERIKRLSARTLPAEERRKTFHEVEATPTAEEISQETIRCMSCGCLDSFTCQLREYARMYGAMQDTFKGEMLSEKIDDSHPFVVLDNNKCILCGRCINLTHEITGEGLIDNLNRGFQTKNGPPIGTTLGDVDGAFVGNFVDDCPTGAFVMKTPFPKDGPWEVSSKTTVCNECGMGCEMNIDVFMNFAVNVSAPENSWNYGLVCDRPRFSRDWEKKIEKPMIKKGNGFKEITLDEAKAIIKEHRNELAIILTPDTTVDEAMNIITFADKHKFKIGAIFDEGVSTAKFADILKSKRINLKVDLSDYPLLKPFIHIAKKQGAIITCENPDIVIVNAPNKPETIPTIIIHRGVNELGLMSLNLKGIPKAKNYLIIGSTTKRLKGYNISLGNNKNADLLLPHPAWINRSGKIITSENRELMVNKIIDGPTIIEILNTYF